MIKRRRIQPYSDYLERYRKAKSFPVSVANGLVFVSGLPPFAPDTGEIARVAFEVQAERVMAQLKHCLEAAGSSLRHVLKCNVYCTPEPSHFAAFNVIYDRYFAEENPARIFVRVPSWPGAFDVEIDCVARWRVERGSDCFAANKGGPLFAFGPLSLGVVGEVLFRPSGRER
jgi:2-iminobutanoate/2-iminopropanoate deaminase